MADFTINSLSEAQASATDNFLKSNASGALSKIAFSNLIKQIVDGRTIVALPDETDVDTVTTQGFYTLHNGVNIPAGTDVHLIVLPNRGGLTWVHQICISTDVVFMRYRANNTSAFGPWEVVSSRATKLGSPTITDVDTIIGSGRYSINNTDNNIAHAPTGGLSVLEVFRAFGDMTYQIFYAGDLSYIFIRRKAASNADWGPWKRIATTTVE